jgi:hypothetical protein
MALLAAACARAAPTSSPVSPTPIIQTVQVTRQVTEVVTNVVTVEATQLVNVVITNTPTVTPHWTVTSSPTPMPTKKPTATAPWQAPLVELVGAPGAPRVICYYGPSTAYLYKTGENIGIWMRALGRNEDGTWIVIDAGSKITNLACWIATSDAKFLSGSVADLPVTWLDVTSSYNYLTGGPLYGPPTVFTTSRQGNEVTITWQPIWMTEDDYNGYLIEAWVCQGSKLVFRPIGKYTSYNDNQLTIAKKSAYSVTVTDEPGCTLPSRGRLYAVEKHGYTAYMMLPWPTFEAKATSTP